MSRLGQLAGLAAVAAVITCATVYAALPNRLAPVVLNVVGDSETALKIVGDHGGGVTRTFALLPAPKDTPRLGIALRPATYLLPPSATITVAVGGGRCTFGPHQYTDGGTITCPITQPGARSMRVSVRGATGPVALIERKTPAGRSVAGIWVQIPPTSFGDRLRFALTALSTTRPWLFSWPLAIFGFALSVCGTLWLGLSALSNVDGLDAEDGPAGAEPATSA